MARMLKVVGIGLAMGLVIASLGEAWAGQAPSVKHFSSASVQPGATLTGYTVVDSGAVNAPVGVQTHARVACPTGTKPIGGGVGIASNELAANVNSSFPDGNGWSGDVNNGTASSTTFNVFAVCAKKPAGYKVVKAGVSNPPGTQTRATATCPNGAKVLGGGGLSSSSSLSVNLNTTIPASSNSWRADQNNATRATEGITAYAICGKNVTGWKLVTGASVANPAGDETHSLAQCPGGRRVLGGGVYSSSFSTAVNINSSYPAGSLWEGFENNADATDAVTRTVAICATV